MTILGLKKGASFSFASLYEVVDNESMGSIVR